MEKYPDFDWKQYIENYRDLRDAGINTREKAIKHWINNGEKENRTYKFIIPNELLDFDWEQYIENYQDLRDAGIDTKEKAIKHWINHGKKEERTCKKNILNNKVTIISSLFNCDEFIDNYLNCLKNLKNLEDNRLIIWNVVDSNSEDTNKKISNFCENKDYIKLLLKTKSEDTGLYDSWNNMLKMVNTELVCNYNVDDKLHPNFLIDYLKEFKNNKKLNLLFSPLLVSKNKNDTFESNLPLMFDKKKIIYSENDKIGSIEPEYITNEYNLNTLKNSLENNLKTKSSWVEYNNVNIFDFFRIDSNNYLELSKYNLFTFPGCCPMWKYELFTKYGGFNEKEYKIAADIELWLRFFEKEGEFKKLSKSYIIYYDNPNSYGHKIDHKIERRKIIKKYHPIFKIINTKIDVIIPYRDREKELKLFLENFEDTFKIYFDYKIYLCDQNDDKDFNRASLINVGLIESERNNLLITDIDLLFKEIPKSLLFKNQKVYGINKNTLSFGGGSLFINKENLLNYNGYSNYYEGWGSEDMDATYRIKLNNESLDFTNMIDRDTNDKNVIEELKLEEQIENYEEYKQKKLNYSRKNNSVLISQIINYLLIFYYENKDKFEHKDEKIYFNNKIFFEGKYKDILNFGTLYDIISDDHIVPWEKNLKLYYGSFENGIPTGLGINYNLWGNPCSSGIFLNGYLFKSFKVHEFRNNFYDKNLLINLEKMNKINILDNEDFQLYKKIVYNGHNNLNYKKEIFGNDNLIHIKINFNNKLNKNILHLPKKLNCGMNIEKYLNNNENISESINYIKNNKYTMYYYDNEWQYPVITEKRVFELYYENKNFPCNYLAFPWATMYDKINTLNQDFKLFNIINNFKINKNKCFTVCQHIAYKRLLPLFKKIGITHVFVSHSSLNDIILEEKYGIKILPFILYPYNENENKNIIRENSLLCSFKGSYGNYYLTDVREKLMCLNKYDDCYINVNDEWHFNNIVYQKQILNKNTKIENKEKEEINFKKLLLKSKFSLCPGGSGPNTIRLWESMSFGSIPVILSNSHKLPELIDWNDICIVYNEYNIDGLYEYLKNIPENIIKYKSKKCIEIFNKYFSKENFTEIINLYFKNI